MSTEQEEELEGIGHLSAQEVAQLKDQGAIVVVESYKGRGYAFKAPGKGPWLTCFNDMQDSKKNTALAMERLVIQCVVTKMDELQEALAARPPLVQKFFAEIMEASGLDDSDAKKL